MSHGFGNEPEGDSLKGSPQLDGFWVIPILSLLSTGKKTRASPGQGSRGVHSNRGSGWV